MNALGRKHPWPSFAFLLVLAVGALLRDPAPAAAQTTDAAAMRDIAYGPHPRQRFDVYLPARPKGAPTIVYVHGGGWQRGDKAMRGLIEAKQRRWTAAGAIVISTNYRLVPDADPVEQARDVARAVGKAQALVADLGGDPDGFVLMGHSAGGHLVALLAASPAMAREFDVKPWRASVLLDAGAIDVVSRLDGGAPALFDNAFGSDPAFWRAASPLHQLQAKTAPILAVCASLRRDSCDDNRGFVDKARGLGGRAELLPKPLSHMQINRDLGEDNAYTREVEAFLRSVGVPLRH
ncbi:alpha/beta hydrolase [Lysobacter hankyongensis]|uniref:Alpha/beta hydrolase n=1 Tax=Lysobacter hankyongensis TaxID=1176535 RepID=A0ABP9C435_9GAMM